MKSQLKWIKKTQSRFLKTTKSMMGSDGSGGRRNVLEMDMDKIKQSVCKSAKRYYCIHIDENLLTLIVKFIEIKWKWSSYYSQYDILEEATVLRNNFAGDSNWNRWAFTNDFPSEGRAVLSIKIDRKRPEKGWLGLGVIRSSFENRSGGFEVYSQNAIFVDPSWDNHEPHFNLKSLDVNKQSTIDVGHTVSIVLDNDRRSIEFFLNEEDEPFAVGDWAKLDFESVRGYAILTTENDQVSINL